MYDLVRKEYILGCSPPEALENAVLDLVQKKYGAQIDSESVKTVLNTMFANRQVVDYSKIVEEYLLYYFPVNLFKIWKPLIDLCERQQMLPDIEVLEIGCGPGSSTFGLIELYRFMAIDNPQTKFKVSIILVEQHVEFLKAFEYLFDKYKSILPDNLEVLIEKMFNNEVENSIAFVGTTSFDLIYASNVFNSNEKYGIQKFKALMCNLKPYLKNSGSIIIIEPAEQIYAKPFLTIRNELQNDDIYTIYSPCNSMYTHSHIMCCTFSMAKIHLRNSILLNELKRNAIISKGNHLVHNFQYAVFRKDELRKYDLINKKHDKLNCLSVKMVGERVNIFANVITVNEKSSGELGLLLCDGTLQENEKVWLNISNDDLEQHKIGIKIVRGERIVLKGAIVGVDHKVKIDASTKVEVYF